MTTERRNCWPHSRLMKFFSLSCQEHWSKQTDSSRVKNKFVENVDVPSFSAVSFFFKKIYIDQQDPQLGVPNGSFLSSKSFKPRCGSHPLRMAGGSQGFAERVLRRGPELPVPSRRDHSRSHPKNWKDRLGRCRWWMLMMEHIIMCLHVFVFITCFFHFLDIL